MCNELIPEVWALSPTTQEMATARKWFKEHWEAEARALPFAFTYGGRAPADLLETWGTERSSEKLDGNRRRWTLTYTDSKTGLELRCEAIEYRDFPTVEWTLYFRNSSSADTPIIEDIHPLDIHLERRDNSEFLLHHAVGSPSKNSDYGLLETVLGPNSVKRITAEGGRPTQSDLSYFNLEWDKEGMIIVLGWPGQWAAEFARDDATGVRVRAGQELTHFKLLPGEEVRSPLIVLQFWQGDWIRSQNIWRHWMMAHSMPRAGGNLPHPHMLGSSARQYHEMTKATEANQIMFIDRYLEEGLDIDYWWMDAGWYVQDKGWPETGTWEVDTRRFPRGLKPVSDHAHSKDIKTLLWFEPERVAAGTWLAQNHPEWVLQGPGDGLLNLGDPDAWSWLTNHVDKLLTDNGIDLYRQDFNMDCLEHWRRNDAPDRQGITEIKHVTGYLALWDELRRRRPEMLIDSCASGGRRNDLETMRRSVPLWRSDYAFEPVGHQCITYGMALWMPYYGTGTTAAFGMPFYGEGFTPVEPYVFWSNACPSLACAVDMRCRELDYDALRRLFSQWRDIAPYYYSDFYPLTAYRLDNTVWMAWQFNRPESGDGIVQVFRRADSPYESARFRLHGLEPAATYALTDLDLNEPVEMSGSELTEQGLHVCMPNRPEARVITYHKTE